jgi:hypothetical protein
MVWALQRRRVMNYRTPFFFAVLSLLIGVAACDDDDDPQPGTAGTGGSPTMGSGGTGGSPTMGGGGTGGSNAGSGGSNAGSGGSNAGSGGSNAGSGGGGGQASSGFDELQACAATEPCEESSAQLIENVSYNVEREGVRCVLESLRDRKTGRYLHVTDHAFTSGAVGAKHLLLVSADGTVRYARDHYAQGSAGEVTDPLAQRCQLADPSYFAGCLTALGDSGSVSATAFRCSFGDGTGLKPSVLDWFTSCEDEAPLCE